MAIFGPAAHWLQDDAEALVYQYAVEEAKTYLKSKLLERILILNQPEPSLDDILLEIRRQVADSAVDGHITEAADLQEIAVNLVTAYQERKRL